ncbi:TonB-linked outer membrane protein, SusC/RagA family [Pedobacter caeni]|uniref:TonB-linked outer membrane protein, SusC/RagA family n=2 Tax=Pedobacter caeni TaxID=288992 RepID=A0A1M4TVQ2_9SPHI|nr:TonB-linked outer membrane protein, SusC/RagA family [Pedobacter caeni]
MIFSPLPGIAKLHAIFSWRNLLIMRLVLFLMLAVFFQSYATGFAQKVTISKKEASLESVFREIRRQTQYNVICDASIIKRQYSVSLNIKDVSVETAIAECLKSLPLTYLIEDKNVIIHDKKSMLTAAGTQNALIKGLVTDVSGGVLPGVAVTSKSTGKATKTDSDGTFVIEILQSSDELTFSYVGFKTQTVKVSAGQNLKIVMEESLEQLKDVVVVGYGTQKKKDVLGAVSVITSEEFEDRPSTNMAYSMQGKAAGVQIVRPSGKPQGGFSMRVRGTTSVTAGSEPLYVIDGVPTQLVYDINPNDIESISILKDASSAAIYGASGANGVVLITTKRGSVGKARLNFTAYSGLSKTGKKLKVLDRTGYLSLMDELGQVANWDNFTANTNWHDEVFRTANLQNYQLTVDGGTEQTKYYISGAYANEQGVVKSNAVQRGTFKTNLDQKINDVLTVGTSVSYARWFDRNIVDNVGSGNAGVIMNVLTAPPVIGIYNEDGTFTANPLRLSFNNPVAYIDGSENGYHNSRFYGNIYANVNIVKGLKFRTMFGYDNYNSKYNYFLDPFSTDWGRVNRGIATFSTEQSEYWLSENTLEYKTIFKEKHAFEALAGFTSQKKYGESSSMLSKGFSSTAVKTVNGGSIFDKPSATRSQRSNLSLLSRIRYTYDDKYLLSSNFRADASSVFGPDHRWGYFPSLSVGWRISKENFLKDVDQIDDIKIRYAWGSVGNDAIGAYGWYGLVSTGSNIVQGGQVHSGTVPSTPENKLLQWEATIQNNIGLDVALFGNRLNLTIDAYRKKTSHLLLDKPVPLSSGFSGALQNIGNLENKGLEFLISSKNTTKTFKWNTDFNISFNRNKVGYIGDQDVLDGFITLRQEASLIREGLPLGVFYGYIANGVDPQTGMMIYQDLNGDQVIDAADKAVIGNPNPKFTYGLTNTFGYKNWSLSVFIQGVQGNDVFNATRVETEAMNDFRNQSVAVLDRWTTPGQITDIPKAIYGNVTNSDISSRFVENGSYARLKSVTLGYSLPKRMLGKLGLSNASVYLTGENLLTVTNYSGYDPEASAYSGNGAFGIDFGSYPQSRQVIFGLNVSF